jgi:hypothetical protein
MKRGSPADNLKRLLMADPRKSAMLGGLMLLLLVLGIRQFAGGGPASAPASTGDAAIPSIAETGQQAVTRALASLDESRGGGIVQVPRPPELARDLFALHPDHFPEPAQAVPAALVGDALEGSEPRAVESKAENADALRARHEAQLVEETKGWSVRSLMLGSSPTVVIETSGADRRRSVLRPGASVLGWALVEAGAAGVLLEKQGVRVRLPVSGER